MLPHDARALAMSLMHKHGLPAHGWAFAFNNRKRALGLCAPSKRTIYLSRYFLDRVAQEELEDTVLHEIAHALDFIRHGSCSGHGPRWKAIAREIGARDARVFKGKVSHDWKYVLKFGDEIVTGFHRKPSRILRNLPTLALRGRPETKGQLTLCRVA